jgi:hypothetical protein
MRMNIDFRTPVFFDHNRLARASLVHRLGDHEEVYLSMTLGSYRCWNHNVAGVRLALLGFTGGRKDEHNRCCSRTEQGN